MIIIADGSMENLDGKWILAKDTACPEKDQSPATLGLFNMAGRNNALIALIVCGFLNLFSLQETFILFCLYFLNSSLAAAPSAAEMVLFVFPLKSVVRYFSAI